MQNIKCIVQYDGTGYSGWQRQPNSLGIQQVIEECLAEITGTATSIITAGRTDRGVHARANVFHFQTSCSIPPDRVAPALNSKLPGDINIIQSEPVGRDFHARYSAVKRKYTYYICTGPFSVFLRNYRWFMSRALDEAAMRAAASQLCGEHDFNAFRSSSCGSKTSIRTMHEIHIAADGQDLVIDVTANAFLKNMVRIIIGTLVDVGTGRIAAGRMGEILASGDRTLAAKTAPPQGLFLTEVMY